MSSVADMDILLEEEADKQRVVEEQQLAEYVAVVKQGWADAERAREERAREEEAKQKEEARRALARDIYAKLKISVPLDRVRIDTVGDFGQWYPAVDFGGVTFAMRYMNPGAGGLSYKIHIARPCARGCGHPVWEPVTYPSELVYELERENHEHDYTCMPVVEEEDDYEIVEPKSTPAQVYADAVRLRRQLHFERAKQKELAIRRIIANKGVTFNGESFVAGSATAAEKLVEFDQEYSAHCAALTEAVVAEIAARAAYIAAGGNPSKDDEEV